MLFHLGTKCRRRPQNRSIPTRWLQRWLGAASSRAQISMSRTMKSSDVESVGFLRGGPYNTDPFGTRREARAEALELLPDGGRRKKVFESFASMINLNFGTGGLDSADGHLSALFSERRAMSEPLAPWEPTLVRHAPPCEAQRSGASCRTRSRDRATAKTTHAHPRQRRTCRFRCLAPVPAEGPRCRGPVCETTLISPPTSAGTAVAATKWRLYKPV